MGFRGYAQRDPLNEYKTEAFQLFEGMLDGLRDEVTEKARTDPSDVEEEQQAMMQQLRRSKQAAQAAAAAASAPHLRRRRRQASRV